MLSYLWPDGLIDTAVDGTSEETVHKGGEKDTHVLEPVMCGYSTSVASENENGLDSGISIDPDEFRTADEIQYDKTVEREWKEFWIENKEKISNPYVTITGDALTTVEHVNYYMTSTQIEEIEFNGKKVLVGRYSKIPYRDGRLVRVLSGSFRRRANSIASSLEPKIYKANKIHNWNSFKAEPRWKILMKRVTDSGNYIGGKVQRDSRQIKVPGDLTTQFTYKTLLRSGGDGLKTLDIALSNNMYCKLSHRMIGQDRCYLHHLDVFDFDPILWEKEKTAPLDAQWKKEIYPKYIRLDSRDKGYLKFMGLSGQYAKQGFGLDKDPVHNGIGLMGLTLMFRVDGGSSSSDDDETNNWVAQAKSALARSSSGWLKADTENPLDLLDTTKIAGGISNSNPANRKRGRDEDNDVDDAISMDLEGKLVIKEDEDEDEQGKETIKGLLDDGEKKYKKRSGDRYTKEAGDGNPNKRRKKAGDKNVKGKNGTEFKAKRGTGGDVQKGNLQPYAYLPLDHRFLNRKKKREAPRQYSNLVQSGRDGKKKKNNRNELKY